MDSANAAEVLDRFRGRRLDLAHVLDRLRLAHNLPADSSRALFEIPEGERPTISGTEIDALVGPLLHYTTASAAQRIRDSGRIGLPESGVWLTSTPYDGHLASAELGLDRPSDTCLIVDVAALGDELFWGPGFADPSTAFPSAWQGGGLAFFLPHPIDWRHVLCQVECSRVPPHFVTEGA